MNSILKDISVANIVTPGDIYILIVHKSNGPDTMEYMYCIKSDDEIIPAIDMEISCYTDYNLKKFIAWERITPSCIEFKFFSYDKEEKKNVKHALYLHRINTLEEALQEAFK